MVLGIEAVLANGEIWDGLGSLKKDNSGYNFKDLLIGSEGTLGIITAATLKLWPRPADVATAFVATDSLSDLATLFSLAEARQGVALTAFEFISERAMHFALRHMPGARLPFCGAHAWYALIEVSTSREDTAAILLQDVLEQSLHCGAAVDTAVAITPERQRELWRLREGISEAQKFEGGSIKHDISVPVAALPAFLAEADALIERLCSGARPAPFGHFGDGNVHYNVSQPVGMDKATFLHHWEEISAAVHHLAVSHGGSISAEHGIGQLKRHALSHFKSTAVLGAMRTIKTALDPHGVLNPGKVLPD
jgi:FAD/FMN-containing dehydrogenase